MRILLFIIFCFPLMTSAQLNKDSVMIKRMADEIMTNGKAYDLLRELTKNIGGRLAGSPEQHNAAIWGKINMEAFQPDKVFFQPCKTPNWKRGGKDYAAIVGVDG
ncbi:MAG: peptidase M28 family protein, partial [Chitinophagaceae bacterium]|nr:peptidase M28 family protein [Chitinophagaceae bacterium]